MHHNTRPLHSTTPGITTSVDFAECESTLDGVLVDYADRANAIDDEID